MNKQLFFFSFVSRYCRRRHRKNSANTFTFILTHIDCLLSFFYFMRKNSIRQTHISFFVNFYSFGCFFLSCSVFLLSFIIIITCCYPARNKMRHSNKIIIIIKSVKKIEKSFKKTILFFHFLTKIFLFIVVNVF